MNGSDQNGIRRPNSKVAHRARRRRQEPAPATTLAILDRLLLGKVRISLGGREREITALEAIIRQLVQKQAAGDIYASRILLKYEALFWKEAEAPLKITFVDSDYTHALADAESGATHG
jgi:hypothetical protein